MIYGSSKIKNKIVQRALNSDIVSYVVEETQNKAKNKLNNLFGGVWPAWVKELAMFKLKML